MKTYIKKTIFNHPDFSVISNGMFPILTAVHHQQTKCKQDANTPT